MKSGIACEKPKPAQEINGRFSKGNIGGGRKIGSRNMLGECFVDDVYSNWLLHGAETIDIVRRTRPADYLKVVASILPTTVNVNVSVIEAMKDDELNTSIRRLCLVGNDAEGKTGAALGAPDGARTAGATEQALSLHPISETG